MRRVNGTILLWLVALSVAGVGAYYNWFYSGEQMRDGRFSGRSISVRVATATELPFVDVIEAIGTGYANESVVITSPVSDTVSALNFDDGELVEAGRVLLELTNQEERAMVQEAEVNLLDAQRQFDRIKDLQVQGNASEAQLDTRQRDLNAARSQLSAVRARLQDRIITAPFSGMLGLRYVSLGSLVSPGEKITTLDDISVIKVDFSVPEKFLSALSPGQEIVTSASAYPQEVFRGTVKTIGTRVDPVTRAVTVRAEIQNPAHELRPGMLLSIALSSNLRNSFAVPVSSIIPVGELNYVYVVSDENTADRREVTLGSRRNGAVEIVSGLQGGEKVISSGLMRLRPDVPVEIIGEESVERASGSAGR